MPTNTEKTFFIEAFKFLDHSQGTRWLTKYHELLRQSPNGRINWKEIPGLLQPNRGPSGYIGAVLRISDLILAIKRRSPRNPQLQTKYSKLVQLAKEVYESRRDHQGNVQRESGFFTYLFFKLSCCVCLQNEDTTKHTAAKRIWREIWHNLMVEERY